MQVLLYEHIASAGELRIFITDQGEFGNFMVFRVFGAVNETYNAAHIKIAKPVDFIDDGHSIAQLTHDLREKFKAKIHLISANM
ncbi:hypothetical protein D3C81_2076240 [compost metagenome]